MCTPGAIRVGELLLSADPTYLQPDEAANEAIRQAIGNDRQIVALHTAFRMMSESSHADRSKQLPRLQESDPQNGIYAWLELFPLIEQERTEGSTTSRPAPVPTSGPAEAALIAAIARTLDAPQAKLYQSDERRTIERILAADGPKWRAALDGLRYAEMWPPEYREVLRDLSDRLLNQARAWQATGRQREAAAAEQSFVRLETDLVDDSPLPGVAFLASELLPQALDALAKDGTAAGIDPEKARSAATQAVQFARDYHQAGSEETSIIPWTGGLTLVPGEQRALMLSLTIALLVAGSWAVLFAVTATLGLITWWTPVPAAPLVRTQGRRAWLAGLVIAAPLLVIICALAVGRPSYMYLYSFPSMPVALLSPVLVLPMIGLASRLFFRPSTGPDWRIPKWGLAAMPALIVVSVLLGLAILPLYRQPWRPPVSVQIVRKLGVALELGSAFVVFVWLVWGQIRRRRGDVRAGALSRANLSVACRALLLISLLLGPVMILSSIADAHYQSAFLAAMHGPRGAESPAYPIAARLGPDWQQKYFGPARELVRR